jgi:curved DNA-binding protein CbpA
MSEDFYDLLGVDGDATRDELKRAYREAAREYHPDVNDDDRAGAQFKAVHRAYEVLRDEDERAEYDRLGHETYVRKRLGGLPSIRGRADEATRGAAGASDTDTGTGTGTASGPRTDPDGSAAGSGGGGSTASGSARTGRGSERSSAASADARGDGRSYPSQRRRSRHRASTSTAGGSGGVESEPDGATGRTRRAYGSREPVDPDETEAGARTRTAAASNRYVALRLRWVAVFVGAAVYAAGVAQYGLANGAALASYAAGVAETPALVTADAGLTGPLAFVAGAAADRSAALLFPTGLLALPLVLAVTVAQYGRGNAWLYVVGAAAPLALPAVGSVPTASTALMLGLLALPLLSAGLFLSDVGRFLLAAGG